jgi:hypothetical protein
MMKRWICMVALLLGLPSLAMGGDCLIPFDVTDGSIHHFWLKHQVINQDADWMNPPGKSGCLDTGVLKGEGAQGVFLGSFEHALQQSRLQLSLGHILRYVNKDPVARVYLCPGGGPEWNFNVLSSRTVDAIAGETDIPADLVINIVDRNFKESQCRRVPGVEIANLHDSIPPGLFAYLLKHLPDLQGKPFPPEVQPDLNPTSPIEPPEREAPGKTSPPLM